MQQLTEYELVPEEWGGDIICVPVSAHTEHGHSTSCWKLMLLVAEVKELKANPDRAAKGTVIEARLDKGRGPIATVLVQNGTLHTGDVIVAGTAVGRVRAMTDDKGRKVEEAGPSVPVEIMGLDEVPVAGDIFNAVDRRAAGPRAGRTAQNQPPRRSSSSQYQKVTLDNLFDQMQQGEMKELDIIVKADVQGSVEAVQAVSGEAVQRARCGCGSSTAAVGAVSESDVMLADASNAIIVGFNVRPDPVAQAAAERAQVELRMYRIIYDCIEEIESAMKGMLAPKTREVMHWAAPRCARSTKSPMSAPSRAAMCWTARFTRNDLLRVVRDGIIVADDKMISLKRFKDDVKEVAQGYECGIGLERFNDIKEGDIFETYVIEEYRE